MLINRRMIAVLGDVFLHEHSPFLLDPLRIPGGAAPGAGTKPAKRERLGSKVAPPDFKDLLKLLSLLVRSCATDTIPPGPAPVVKPVLPQVPAPAPNPSGAIDAPGSVADSGADSAPDIPQPVSSSAPGQASRTPATFVVGLPDSDLLPMHPTDKRVVTCQELYVQSLANNFGPEWVVQIASHWAFENGPFSDMLVAVLLKGFASATQDQIKQYFDFLRAIFDIPDSVQPRRLATLLHPDTGLLAMLHRYRGSARITYTSIKLLLDMLESNEAFALAMMEHRNQWLWMDKWLKQFTSGGTPSVGESDSYSSHTAYNYSSYNNTNYNGYSTYPYSESSSPAHPPLLARQESKEQTFSKYQAQLEKYGRSIALAVPEATAVHGSAGGSPVVAGTAVGVPIGSSGGAAAAPGGAFPRVEGNTSGT